MLTKTPSLAEKEDPRVKRTRQLLVQAFNELLMEKSFDAMTVQDIADRATVNRATFYAHFDDKYALLDYVARESFQQALSSKLPPHAVLGAPTLQLLIQIVCEYLEWHFVYCKASIRTQFDSLLEQQVKLQVYQALLAWLNSAASQEDAELRATAASWAIYGLALRWSRGERKESAAKFARRALPLIMVGLEAPVLEITTK